MKMRYNLCKHSSSQVNIRKRLFNNEILRGIPVYSSDIKTLKIQVPKRQNVKVEKDLNKIPKVYESYNTRNDSIEIERDKIRKIIQSNYRYIHKSKVNT